MSIRKEVWFQDDPHFKKLFDYCKNLNILKKLNQPRLLKYLRDSVYAEIGSHPLPHLFVAGLGDVFSRESLIIKKINKQYEKTKKDYGEEKAPYVIACALAKLMQKWEILPPMKLRL